MGNSILDRIIADRPNPTPELIERCRLRAEQLAKENNTPTRSKRSRSRTILQRQQDLAAKMGMDYAEWLAQANKYYAIDPTTFTVTSIARCKDKPQTWLCSSMEDAQLKIVELIEYKYNDHFIKGCDFMWT
jgi:hypothetical protein